MTNGANFTKENRGETPCKQEEQTKSPKPSPY